MTLAMQMILHVEARNIWKNEDTMNTPIACSCLFQTKMSCCAPCMKPVFQLYPGEIHGGSVRMLLPVSWFQAIICFAPRTHVPFCESSVPQYTGGLAGASFRVDVAPVTLHLSPCMYMLGVPQPLGTQSQAQWQPPEGQAGRSGTLYVARRFQGVLAACVNVCRY